MWASLSAAREPLEEARDKLADPEQVSVHARVEAILNLLEGRLQTIDAQVAYFGALDSIDSNLQTLAASLQQFNDNPGSRPILDQAETQVTGILAYLAQIPPPTAADVENLREIGTRYRKSMSGHIGQITSEVNELTTKAEELDAQVTQQAAQVATEVARLTEAAKAAEALFEVAHLARDEAFDKQAIDFGAAAQKAVADVRKEAEDTLAELEEKAEEAWKGIAGVQRRAQEASNYLGINALAAGYHETAEAEDKRAFWTRIGAIASFLGAIGASVFTVAYHIANSFSLEGVLTKSLLAIPFLVLAGYLARESSRHADRAHFNRQRQRQLESLPAYADGLDPVERGALYQILAPGFFAPVGAAEKDGEKDSDPTGPLLTLLIAELKRRTDSETK